MNVSRAIKDTDQSNIRCRVERSALWEYAKYLAATGNGSLESSVESSIFNLQSSNFNHVPVGLSCGGCIRTKVRVCDKKQGLGRVKRDNKTRVAVRMMRS